MKRPAAVVCAALPSLLGLLSGILYGSIWCLFFFPFSAALLASLLYMFRSPLLYISPLISAALSFVFTHGIISSFFAAAYVIPATVLAVTIYRERAKSFAVVSASVSIFAAGCVMFALTYLISPDTLLTYDGIIDAAAATLASVKINSGSEAVQFFSDEGIEAITSYLSISMPAAVALLVYALAYAAVSLTSFLMRIFSFTDKIPGGVGRWIYKSNPVSAVMFFVSYFSSVLLMSYDSADNIGVAAENLLLILTPPMMIAGERAFFGFAASHYKTGLSIFATVMALLLLPSFYIMVISFLGAGYIIAKSLSPYISKLMGKFSGGDDDNDDDDDDFYD